MSTGDGKARSGGAPRFTDFSGCWVAVCDADSARAQRIRTMITSLGARCLSADAIAPPHAVLMAVPAANDDCVLAEIRHRHAAGQIVIAYGEGADNWALGRKCRPLIAGARRLLDADAPAFVHLLSTALRETLGALLGRLAEERTLRERLSALGVEGRGPAMLDVFRQVLRFATLGDLPVLVTGETGTGKERIARALHASDPRRSRAPFVAVNCGALVSTLAESELFGHRRGAFTGAERARPGLIRAADGGVLFLDEIGELEPALQTKLLRVVQEGRVLGVGEEAEAPVDVRIIAATHRDLPALVAAGRFRADLLHRLAVLPLHLPPLRERPEDIPLLVEYLLGRYRRLHPAALQSTSGEFLAALARLRLEGNVRQLENILRQSLVHKRGEGPLGLADLPATVLAELAGSDRPTERDADARIAEELPNSHHLAARDRTAPPPGKPAPSLNALMIDLAERHSWNLASCLRACEREVFSAALSRMAGNQTRAAQLLGLSPRCVYNKLRKLGIRDE
jgi:DNA-binding NtrC family response regulator